MISFDVTAARAALTALRERELDEVRAQQQQRSDALAQVRGAISRITEIGSPDGMLDRAAEELGTSSAFDRVVLSRLIKETLTPHAVWESMPTGETLADVQVALGYPLIEAEVAQQHDARIVEVSASGQRTPVVLRDRLGWTSYVVVALTLRGTTIGLLHADASCSGRTMDELDREVAARYAEALARSFELAALRHALQNHRDGEWAAVRWLSGRLEQSEGAATQVDWTKQPGDPLTPREQEVIELLARGRTNVGIAGALTISEGTAKYHVANVLRKLGATSRADAVARHLHGGN